LVKFDSLHLSVEELIHDSLIRCLDIKAIIDEEFVGDVDRGLPFKGDHHQVLDEFLVVKDIVDDEVCVDVEERCQLFGSGGVAVSSDVQLCEDQMKTEGRVNNVTLVGLSDLLEEFGVEGIDGVFKQWAVPS